MGGNASGAPGEDALALDAAVPGAAAGGSGARTTRICSLRPHANAASASESQTAADQAFADLSVAELRPVTHSTRFGKAEC